MAEDRIESEDIIVKDPFKNLGESADATKVKIIALEQSLDMVVETTKVIQKGLKTVKPVNTKGIKELEDLQKRSNQTMKAKLGIDREVQKQNIKLKEQRKALNNELKEEITLEKRQLGTLEKVSKRSKILRDRKQALNLETRKGRRELKLINSELNRNNKFIERNSTALGKQKIGIGRYKNALGGLSNVLGKLGIAFGAFTLLKDAFTTVKDFQQGTADLASVLGEAKDASGQWSEGMLRLVEQQKVLGASTTFTATEVSGLQKEYAKLGFVEAEIGNVTEATLLLAEATGTDLAESASVTGGIINAFGKSSEDTQQVVDLMSKSFSTSSLDMEKFKTGMAAVAPVAKVAGTSIERTTAMLGVLTDNNLQASKAGTGLKNVFLALSKSGMTYEEAMQQINDATDKNGASMALFGKEGATVGVILAEQGVKIDAQTELLELNTEASLKGESATRKMAETQRNTLGGSIKLLSSAWDGYILKLDEAGGVGDKLTWGIRQISENLETILGWVQKAVKWFVIYKATLLALKLKDKIVDFRNFKKAVKEGADGAQKATSSIKNFGRALKGIGIGLVIGLLVEMAQAFWDIASGAQRARFEMDLFNKSVENGANLANELIVKNRDILKQKINEIKLSDKSQKQKNKEIKEATAHAKQQIKDAIDLTEKIKLEAREKKKIAKEELDAERKFVASGGRGLTEQATFKLTGLSVSLAPLQNAFAKARAEIQGADSALEALRGEYKDLDQVVTELIITEKDSKRALGASTGEIKKASTELKTYIDLLAELTFNLRELDDIQRELNAIRRDREITDLQELIDLKTKENELNIKAGKGSDTTEIENLIGKRVQLELDGIDEVADAQLVAEREAFDERFELMADNALKSRAELLSQDGLTADDRLVIEANYQAELEKIRLIRLDAQENLTLKENVILEDANNQKLDIIKTGDKEIIDLKKSTEDQIADYAKKKADEELKRQKEMADKQREIIKALTDFMIRNIDERIAKVDDEILANQKKADMLKQMAINGNIEEKDSLAEQNRLIAEGNAEKQRLEERKQRILLVSAVLQSYNAELASGATSTEAFTKAITSTTLLNTFINTIPTFFDGTENTGSHGQGIDGRGGFSAVLHPNERVMTAKQNAKVGEYSNEFVAQKMEDYRMGRIVDGASSSSGWENQLLVEQLMNVENKLDAVNETIKNRPVSNTEIGNITKKSFEIMETKTQGNRTTINTYTVKHG